MQTATEAWFTNIHKLNGKSQINENIEKKMRFVMNNSCIIKLLNRKNLSNGRSELNHKTPETT